MSYGELKIDTITFTAGGVDASVSVSGLVQNPTFTGNITTTGTISGDVVRGNTVSGATVTGTAGEFGTITGNTAGFTTVTGTTVTGTTANFVTLSGTTVTGNTGQFTNITGVNIIGTTQVSGATVTGDVGRFTTITGGIHTLTSGVFASGTAANPSITFVDDLNTGIYSPGADQVAISTGGTARLFVDASGRVGVGTSPDGTGVLAIKQITDATNGGLVIYATDGTGAVISRLTDGGLTFRNGGSERLRITSDGKVGLGTSSPGSYTSGADFVVANSAGNGAMTLAGADAGSPTIMFKRVSTPSTTRGYIQYDNASEYMRFATNGGERLRIDSSGNVGVGTTSPGEKLHVNGGNIKQQLASSTNGGFNVNNGTNDLIAIGTGGFAANGGSVTDGGIRTTNNLVFATGSGAPERLRIDSSGRVGIGTSSPTQKLHVEAGYLLLNSSQGNGSGDARLLINQGSRQYTLYPWSGDSNSTVDLRLSTPGASNQVTITDAGNVGIGTTSVTNLLHLRSDSASNVDHLYLQNRNGGANSGARIAFSSGTVDYGDNRYAYIGAINTGALQSGNNLVFATNADGGSATEKVRIDSSGRLLVGTSTARSTYYAAGISAGINVEAAGNLASSNRSISVVNGYSASTDGDPILYLGRTRSDSIGGTTSVQSADQVGRIAFMGSDGTNMLAAAQIQAAIDGTPGTNDMPGRLVFSTTADGASSPTERMRITNSGSVFIGTQSALNNEIYSFAGSQGNGGDGVLHVRNTLSSGADASPCLVLSKTATTTTSSARFIQFYANNATQAMGGIVGNGATNVQFASISDIREKENIVELTGCLDKIKQLDVVSYDWKDNRGHVEAGFIAQNVETVFPEYVVENMSDDDAEPRKGITGGMSSGYVAVLTAALQEAIGEIELLKARVAALEAN